MAQLSCRLKDRHLAGDVGIHIGIGVFQRIPHARLCREVHDNPDRCPVDAGGTAGLLQCQHVGPVELKARMRGQLIQPGLFKGRVVIIVETIDTDNPIAACKKLSRHSHTYKTSAAGR